MFTGADHSLENEWLTVVLDDEVIKEVLATFGDEVITKYGSYKNIGNEMIDDILEWLRKKSLQRSAYGW